MKKIILITAFLSLFITPTFSQVKGQFKLDITFKNVQLNPYTVGISRDLNELLSNNLKNDNLLEPNFLTSKLSAQQNPSTTIGKHKYHGEMPCIVPEGFFPMKVIVPDSLKRYSLLIKQL